MSGAEKRRRRRIRELEARLSNAEMRVTDGGDAIDNAVLALRAVTTLAAHADGQMDVRGVELAALLGLIEAEAAAGRDMQLGTI